jgi:hypothetical protein
MGQKHRSTSDRLRGLAATALGIGLAVGAGLAISAQDKYTLQVPGGLAFSEFKGYETWEIVSVSHPTGGEDGSETLNVIVANPAMIKAYAAGIPGNGKPFPDGAKAAKIQYTPKKSTEAPFQVTIPDKLKDVAFMAKDSKRFADTGGWGYGLFLYDSATDGFKPDGTGAKCGAACHTIAKAKDYVFTRYEKK